MIEFWRDYDRENKATLTAMPNYESNQTTPEIMVELLRQGYTEVLRLSQVGRNKFYMLNTRILIVDFSIIKTAGFRRG